MQEVFRLHRMSENPGENGKSPTCWENGSIEIQKNHRLGWRNFLYCGSQRSTRSKVLLEKTRNPCGLRKKIKPKAKFFQNFLIWQTIDELGQVSKPYICIGTTNAKIYKKDCIMKRLLPFIKNRPVVFWPDNATCHYTREITNILQSESIQFVEKSKNAPTVRQARLIFGHYVSKNTLSVKCQQKISTLSAEFGPKFPMMWQKDVGKL